MESIGKTNAILSLRPGAEWVLRGDDLEWLDKNQTEPTSAEIDAEITRLQAEYDAKQYARSRASEYPSIGDQLDMLYHDKVNGTNTWQDAIQAVKDKYPKS